MHASTYRSQVAVQPPGQENDTTQGPTGLPSFGSPGAELTQSSAHLSQQGMGNQAVQGLINASGQQSANKPPADKPPAKNQSFAQHYAKWLNDRIAEVDKLPKDQQAKVARSLLLQTVQVGAKMKAGETVDLAKLSSSPNLSEHGVETPDDLPEEWIFSTQRLLSRFDGGVPGLKFKAVSVNVPKYDQFTPGLGFEIGQNACFDAAKAMVANGGSGATVLGGDKRIQIGKAEDDKGHLKSIDTPAAEQGTNYINQQLLDDRGVMVGVSNEDSDINVDKLTDHWVTITGHYTDENGRVHYTFNDPGTKQEERKTGTMTIDKDGRLHKPGSATQTRYTIDDPYDVSMVRLHKPHPKGKQPNSTTGVKQ